MSGDDRVEEMQEVVDFLCGSGELAGHWYGDEPAGEAPFWWRRILKRRWERILDRIQAAEERVEDLQSFFEECWRWAWEHGGVDGADFQDEAIERGLLVEVPADEPTRMLSDTDTMYVPRWSAAAREALREEEG